VIVGREIYFQQLDRELTGMDCLNNDTLFMTAVRVHAANPGVWFFHCHLGWHLGAGFAGVVVLQPDVLAQTPLPPASRALCLNPNSLDNSDRANNQW